ncbi:formylglycine-generating enzyme family protein [Sphingobacterium lumbrici]|uniref:formylglycine-generating enzyme family protein n=1 Tax=Sphingobacterium lumbrici TaxID=2559600 RepID=UPI00112C7D40|nr:SUMF1/EgtB/PvdO family nonheme iron enzyme [Sphingobacterium lumbrici]
MNRIFLFSVLSISILQAQIAHKRYVQQIEDIALGLTMEEIPGGIFMMGSNSSPNADEKPAHKVKIDPFWMGTYKVAWDIYEPFLYKDYDQSKQAVSTIPQYVDAVTRPTKPYLFNEQLYTL